MHRRGTPDYFYVDRQDPLAKGREHTLVEPQPENLTLVGIASLHAAYPYLEFHHRDDAYRQRGDSAPDHSRNTIICARLAQLVDDVRVEQVPHRSGTCNPISNGWVMYLQDSRAPSGQAER